MVCRVSLGGIGGSMPDIYRWYWLWLCRMFVGCIGGFCLLVLLAVVMVCWYYCLCSGNALLVLLAVVMLDVCG